MRYSFHSLNVEPHARELEALAALIDEGTIAPNIHRAYSFEDVKVALDAQRKGSHVGKLVLRMG
jgi:NADPH:quinone reductase-like Zn-dependent oxidoreductase